jgi:hypothetical protein
MSSPARPRFQLPWPVVGGMIVLFAALIVGLLTLIVPLAVAGQIYLLIIIALGFRYWPPLAHWVAGMPVPHRLVYLLLIGGMIVGHLSLQNRKYFPFVSWKIFTFATESDPISCREFIATTSSGKTVRLLIEQIFPSIVQFDPPKDNDAPAMSHLVHALARVYNQHHAGDPVRRIDLVVYAVKLHPSESEMRDRPSCELLRRYDTSSDLSN